MRDAGHLSHPFDSPCLGWEPASSTLKSMRSPSPTTHVCAVRAGFSIEVSTMHSVTPGSKSSKVARAKGKNHVFENPRHSS
jgi:hypothetical protein